MHVQLIVAKFVDIVVEYNYINFLCLCIQDNNNIQRWKNQNQCRKCDTAFLCTFHFDRN